MESRTTPVGKASKDAGASWLAWRDDHGREWVSLVSEDSDSDDSLLQDECGPDGDGCNGNDGVRAGGRDRPARPTLDASAAAVEERCGEGRVALEPSEMSVVARGHLDLGGGCEGKGLPPAGAVGPVPPCWVVAGSLAATPRMSERAMWGAGVRSAWRRTSRFPKEEITRCPATQWKADVRVDGGAGERQRFDRRPDRRSHDKIRRGGLLPRGQRVRGVVR